MRRIFAFLMTVCMAAAFFMTSPAQASVPRDDVVTLSIPNNRGPQEGKTNGVIEVKLVNHTKKALNCLTSAVNGGKVKHHREIFIPTHVTFWFTGMSVGNWNVSTSCVGGASDQQNVTVNTSGSVWHPLTEQKRFSCDPHGFASFDVVFANYESTSKAKYSIEYNGVRPISLVVKGSHGFYSGIDGIVKKGGDVTVIAKNPKTGAKRTWTEHPPRCQPPPKS